MLKIGVLGAGHLGKIHLKCIKLAKEHFELVGFYDQDPSVSEKVSQDFQIPAFESADALINVVDVVDIVTPTISHFELAQKAILKGKHLFIEKPLTHTLDEAKELVKLTIKKGVKAQVGHVERFNPALLALGDMSVQPMFIEAHRLAVFNPRGTDVSVILDLMIHDLDILLSLVNSSVKNVKANGVAVVSTTPDIGNARIEFQNGCVANLTASRISLKQMRKLRFFQKDAYISLDFLDKKAQVVRLHEQAPENGPSIELPTNLGTKFLEINEPPIEPVNAIKLELESLAESILNNTPPKVNIQDGYKALELAYQIIQEIELNKQRFQG